MANKKQMIEFAQEHVQKALEAAAEKARIIEDESFWSGQVWDDGPLPQIVDKESILSAYPLSNIK